LLGEDRFQDIEKIKTIGSTYMAVSGLSPEKQVRREAGKHRAFSLLTTRGRLLWLYRSLFFTC